MNRIHNIDPSDLIAKCLKLEEMAVLQRPEIQSALMFLAGNRDREISVKQIAERQRVSRRTLDFESSLHVDARNRPAGKQRP